MPCQAAAQPKASSAVPAALPSIPAVFYTRSKAWLGAERTIGLSRQSEKRCTRSLMRCMHLARLVGGTPAFQLCCSCVSLKNSGVICTRISAIRRGSYDSRMAADHLMSRTAMRRQSAPSLPLPRSRPSLPLGPPAGAAPLARKAAFSTSTQRAWSAALLGSSRSMPRAAQQVGGCAQAQLLNSPQARTSTVKAGQRTQGRALLAPNSL